MDKLELQDFLKNNLSLSITENIPYYGSCHNIEVKLLLCDETISEVDFDIPDTD